MVVLCGKRSCRIVGCASWHGAFVEYRVTYGITAYEIGKIKFDNNSKEWYLVVTNTNVVMTRGFVNKLWDNFDRMSKAACPTKYWMGYGTRKG